MGGDCLELLADITQTLELIITAICSIRTGSVTRSAYYGTGQGIIQTINS